MNATELERRLKSSAYRIISFCEALLSKKISKIIEDQLLRSAFSAAANYRAACKAISKKSFVSKLSIAFEEMDESLFRAENILGLKLLPSEKLSLIIQEAIELSSILAAARKTARRV